ncbi:MAG: hypothetical protein ACYC9I_02700 [Desulfuromonadales bacterium]
MTAQQNSFNSDSLTVTDSCPFFDPSFSVCRAALLTFMPDARQLYSYCCGDDHDDCALFLAKALRTSAAGGLDRDVAVLCEK